MHSSRGQATIDYVGAILLVAVVLTLAAVAVAAPGVPAAVVAKLRLGLCIVGGDVCTGAEAKRRGLEPCLVSTEDHDRDSGISLLGIHAGGSDFWSAERRSDGTVVLTEGYGQDVEAGPSFGLHVGGAEAGGSAGAGVGFRSGRSWTVSEAKLREVLKATKGDPTKGRLVVLPMLLGKPDASFLEGGGRSSAELALSVIKNIPGAEGEARAMLGRRKDRDGTTYYADLGSGSAGLITDAIPALETSGHLALEYRTGSPPAVTLRTSGHRDDDETETVMRLSLADPADRAAAQRLAFVAVHAPALAVRDLVARIQARGTVERLRYRTEDDAHGWDYDLGLGVDLGADHATRARRRRLISDELIGGPLPARREDCLSGSAPSSS